MIRLAIVDDDKRILNHLKGFFQGSQEIESVMLSNSGIQFSEDLAKMLPADRPDVVIMDVSMGSADEGIQATSIIKAQFPNIDIIMFTVSDEDERIFEAFKAGAMGYLLKEENPEFILKTILDVRNGGAQMSPVIAKKAIQFMMSSPGHTKELRNVPSQESLTERELEVVQLTADGYSYKEIADKLDIATGTVKKHMTNVFQKLQVKNKMMAVKRVNELR